MLYLGSYKVNAEYWFYQKLWSYSSGGRGKMEGGCVYVYICICAKFSSSQIGNQSAVSTAEKLEELIVISSGGCDWKRGG